jgi:microcystin-dependent protein
MPEDTTTTTTTSTTSTITTIRPCDACYNGCVEIVSDQCVRYTGIGSEALGISTGDSLLTVENILIDRVVSFLDGTGIDITINPAYYCELVEQYLPVGTPNLVEVLSALVRAACELQTQIDAIDGTLAILNADYDVDCLSGVTDSSDTHAVLQAVITKLCIVEANLAALTLDLDTNYVKLADLDALIAAYLASQSGGPTQQSAKMIPFVAYEYYGSLSNFDGTGAGIPANGFNDVYLCNGLNGTPDKRGRVAVGAIASVPPVGIGLDPAVNPAFAGNPNYALSGTAGANTVTLITSQLPLHTHNATVVASGTVGNHTHIIMGGSGPGDSAAPNALQVAANEKADGGNASYKMSVATSQVHNSGITSASGAGAVSLSVAVSNSNTGSGEAHSNIQPVIAAYYIMYIP